MLLARYKVASVVPPIREVGARLSGAVDPVSAHIRELISVDFPAPGGPATSNVSGLSARSIRGVSKNASSGFDLKALRKIPVAILFEGRDCVPLFIRGSLWFFVLPLGNPVGSPLNLVFIPSLSFRLNYI